ncbi:MAG: hypothetical protein IKD39_05940 [Oscillospiraceae bacterium]|nr:hypothetical protein [Oscillospiraceae bacterium]
MKKIISMLMVLILLLTACSSPSEPIDEHPEINESGSNGPSKPVVSEPEEEKTEIDYEYYENLKNSTPTGESEFDKPLPYEDICFTFEVPDLTGTDKSELPFVEEKAEWCINGNHWIQEREELFVQYLCEDKEAVELAKAIAILNIHSSSFSANETFENICEANEKSLLWTAIMQTPWRAYPENENHAFNVTFDFLHDLSNGAYVPCEIYSVSDVEKTFRWLFGEEAKFVPQSIPNHGIRYFEELGLLIQFSDGIMTHPSYPQIISYSEENGVYTVETIMAYGNPGGGLNFYLLNTDGRTVSEIPLNKENALWVSEILKPAVYNFEKAEDGHFILTGFSY